MEFDVVYSSYAAKYLYELPVQEAIISRESLHYVHVEYTVTVISHSNGIVI